ncbi:hypothetical protein HY256_02360, partial [Candidatus Sumerlaeota bacterium]|nr:hypothetical protein [Candidatus Sumerlaeota bacterium]
MNSFLLPLAQFGGLNGDQIIDDMTTYYLKWGSVGFVLLVLLFFIRYLLRAMVNKK